jgi:serine/threonine-protein kinase
MAPGDPADHDPLIGELIDGKYRVVPRIGGELGQENIVEVTDLGEMPSGAPYLVMEYLEGRNLSQILKSQRALSQELAVEVVGRVLEALIAVHQAGVVHRDLKPGNVFLA